MKRGTAAKVILGKDTLMDVPAGIVHGTDVILGGKAGLLNDFGGLVLSNNLMIGKKVSRGTITTVTVRGQSPLVLPDAIAGSLQAVKAFGGTEQNGTPTPDAPVDIVSNNGVLKARHQSGLPLGYTLLEYTESTGTQYIDLGYKGNGNSKVEVKFRYHTASTAAGAGRVFGSRTLSLSNAFAIGSSAGTAAATGNKVFWCYDSQPYFVSDETFNLGVWKTVVFSATEHSIDGVPAGDDYNIVEFETPQNLKLFGFDNNNTMGVGYVDIAYCKLWDNGVLVRDLVPAKNSSNVIGMYDLVSGQFFTNAGTGDFVAGDPVSDPVGIYTDGTVETIEDTIGNTATAEMLLKVGDYQDEQEIISGTVTRKVGVLFLDGTEVWGQYTTGSVTRFSVTNPVGFNIPQNSNMRAYCNILVDGGYQLSGATIQNGTFSYANTTGIYLRMAPNNGITTVEGLQQWLADQYAAGTPVIVVYPLATPTTESVTGQTLQVTSGDNTLEITQASLTGLELEATYKSLVQLTIQEVEDANLNNNVEVTIS